MKAVLLIDADSAIFASCVCKKEESEDGKGFIYNLEDAQHKFDEKVMYLINSLEEDYGFDVSHSTIFLEDNDGTNFRYNINKTYKGNRGEKPPLLKTLKDWIKQTYNNDVYSTFESINVETDDSLAATYKKYHDNDYGVQLIVASPDKDLKTTPCLLFDTYYTRMELQSIDEITAMRNLFVQMLVGDRADNVKGIYRVGKEKAEKLLGEITEPFGFKRAVWSLYKKQYGRRAKMEFYKAYYSLKLNDSNIATPDLDSILMF